MMGNTMRFAWIAMVCGCQLADSQSSRPASAPATQPATVPTALKTVRPFPGIVAHLAPDGKNDVEFAAMTCLDAGWLEQVACAPASREHESLVVAKPKPSQIHAALLLAGFTPGAPGKWTYENKKLGTIPPTGDRLDVLVRYKDGAGKTVEHPIRKWIRDGAQPQGGAASAPATPEFPRVPWVFSGSVSVPGSDKSAPEGGTNRYIADDSGSIIGLVTFGDEVIGFSQVISDQADVQAPEWEVNTDTIPPVGTDVTIILRRFEEDASKTAASKPATRPDINPK